MIKLTDLLLQEAKIASSEQEMDFYAKKYKKTIDYLRNKNKVLLLTTSNRWSKHSEDVPKSTQLALKIQELLGKEKVTLIDTTKLNIVPCEGNVSSNRVFGRLDLMKIWMNGMLVYRDWETGIYRDWETDRKSVV